MIRFVARRLLFSVFVLWGVSLITFFLARVAPGDPARLIAGPHANAEALAMALQLVVSSRLGWLPFGGRLDTGMAAPAQVTGLLTIDSLLAGQPQTFVVALRHLVLPVVTLAGAEVGLMARVARTSMLDT